MKIKKIKFVNFIMCLGLVAIIIFIIYGYRAGIFSSPERFRKFIEGFGVMEALIFLAIQIVQVIVPILPSSIGCVVGIMIFGPWMGFLYNYISICIGSTINFLLAKRYGSPFVKKVIGDKNFNKYIGEIEKGKKFEKIFAIAIFVPGAPDDYLCYIAGLSKIKLIKFILIILFGKPLSIAIFSMGVDVIMHYIFSIIR